MNYFIYYNCKSQVNYIYLLYLYGIAEYNKETKCRDLIKYNNLKELSEKINSIFKDSKSKSKYNGISQSTLSSLLNNESYKEYFTYIKKQKEILLQNHFNTGLNKRPFIVLNDKEYNILINSKDLLFIRYYFYLKYYCGYSKSKEIDTTGKQFLEACGYSLNSGSYLTALSGYNKVLQDNELIKIQKYKDNNGYFRNIYKLCE